MAQTLRLKRSSVAGRVPTTATLQTGEIAINTADGLVYIRKDDDSIIPLLGANTVVTGSVVLLGSIEATSFTGSFSGSFEGPLSGTLSRTIGSGDGIVNFVFDGSENVTVTLDTGSDHFRNAVIDLIDTNAPSIIAQDTTGAGGIDLSYNSETGALSGSLVNSEITIGDNTIALGQTVTSISGIDITGSFKGDASGSFSGSFNGDGSGLTGVTAYGVRSSLSFGSGLTGGTYDGSAPITASLDANSLAFRQAVYNSISVVDTYTSSGVNLVFNEVGGFNFLSAYLQSTTILLGDTTIQLAETASNINNLVLTDTTATGSFTGSFTGDFIGRGSLTGTASYADNATSASHALLADNALTASYVLNAVSASYAEFTVLAQDAISASYAATASSANDFLVRGDLDVQGIVTAREFHTEFVSASIVFSSGSTKFGDTADDVHEFTGSALFSGSIDADDITINDWGSVSASLAQLDVNNSSLTLQDVTDNGTETTLAITASNLNITGYPDVSASLASIQSTNNLQGVTDNGNTTTNQIIINNELTVSSSIYSKGEEVLDFAVAMAIALG
jgi:hypothetical protein